MDGSAHWGIKCTEVQTMSDSKARKLLLAHTGSDNIRVKVLSERDGGQMLELIDTITGDTKAIQFVYPDGTTETKIIRHDYSKDYVG